MQFPPRKKVASCNFVAAAFVLGARVLVLELELVLVHVLVLVIVSSSSLSLRPRRRCVVLAHIVSNAHRQHFVSFRWREAAGAGGIAAKGRTPSQPVSRRRRLEERSLRVMRVGHPAWAAIAIAAAKALAPPPAIATATIFICWPSLCGTRPRGL